MGIIERVKEDFYQKIRTEHVLVLAALDVDALCACKILQSIFKADDVEHTLVPVSGKDTFLAAYKEHTDQVKSVVLINCGGSLNVLELLEPEDGVRFYIIDSRRPLELDNVFNQEQVSIVLREREELELPDFDDIYAADMEEEEDDDDEEYFSDEAGSPRSKRRRTGEEDTYQARKKRHLWKRKREEVLYKYYEFNFHGTAASLVMYELALKLSKDSNDIIWLSIIGLTEQLLYEKIDREKYVTDMHQLQPEVLRHNRSDDETPAAINTMRISFENELRLVLYRHWTLYDSLCNSDYTTCKFKVWSMKGNKKLLEFLADMGLPLTQCRQKYPSMEVQYRESLKQCVDESARKFALDDMSYGSFVVQLGYKHKLCASDVVHAATALMESPDVPYSEAFLSALEALSRSSLPRILTGIEQAKLQQMAIVSQVKNFIDTHQVVCTGPFIYAYVAEGTPNVKYFSKQMMLCKLARFLREAWVATSKRSKDLPFIISAPLDPSEGTCLIAGVPPYSDHTHKSEFAKAFQHAADRIQAHASFNHFDGSVIEMKVEDRGKFFDALTAISAF